MFAAATVAGEGEVRTVAAQIAARDMVDWMLARRRSVGHEGGHRRGDRTPRNGARGCRGSAGWRRGAFGTAGKLEWLAATDAACARGVRRGRLSFSKGGR